MVGGLRSEIGGCSVGGGFVLRLLKTGYNSSSSKISGTKFTAECL